MHVLRLLLAAWLISPMLLNGVRAPSQGLYGLAFSSRQTARRASPTVSVSWKRLPVTPRC